MHVIINININQHTYWLFPRYFLPTLKSWGLRLESQPHLRSRSGMFGSSGAPAETRENATCVAKVLTKSCWNVGIKCLLHLQSTTYNQWVVDRFLLLFTFKCQVLELPALSEFEVALFDNRVGEAGLMYLQISTPGWLQMVARQDGARQMAATMRGLRQLTPRLQPKKARTVKLQSEKVVC